MSGFDGAPTRAERIEAQQDDDGDGSDRVWHVPRASGNHYHEDPDCGRLACGEGAKPITREEARRKWLAPCRVCAGGGG